MKSKSIKLNFVMNAILTMSSMIFPLITFRYVSGILMPEGTGKVSFAISLITYFNMFAQLGIPTYGIRACAMVRDDKEELTRTAHELLAINLLVGALAYIALGLALAFVPSLREDRTLYIVVSSTIFLSAIGMEWLYKALEQYAYITVRSILFKVIALVAMFVLIHKKSDYVIYGGISIFASSAANLVNLFHARKYIGFRPVGNYHMGRHMKAVLVFFAMSCATTVYTNLDTVMLGIMTTKTDVGYYDAAVKVKNILVSVVTSLGTVLLPRASYYIEMEMYDEFKRISAKALNFAILAALPLMLFFMMFARQSIAFLTGGAEYAPATVPMQVIMPTLLLIGITNILGIQILVPLGREKTVLASEIAGAVTDLVLNAILIPMLAATGAAIGTLVAEAVVLLVQYIALRGEIRGAFAKIQYGKILLALVLAFGASFWVAFLQLGSFLTLLIAAAAFFAVYGIGLLVTKEPLMEEILGQTLRKLTGRKKGTE